VNDRDWSLLVDEVGWLVGELRRHGQAAVRRQGYGLAAGPDGYPASSLPEASIASGRVGDPTAMAVVRLAGGSGDRIDTWKRPYDPVSVSVNNMERESRDALARLQGAHASMTSALQGSQGTTTPTKEGEHRE